MSIWTKHSKICIFKSMNIKQMKKSADSACAFLKSLAHPDRIMIVCHLADGEKSVGELAGALDLRASTVSQHLALLRREGILKARREGQTVWYSVKTEGARALVGLLYKMHCHAGIQKGRELT